MSPPFGRNEPPMVPSVGARDLGTMIGRGRTPSAGAGVRGTIDRMGGTETPSATLDEARAAVAERAWGRAHELFAAVAAERPLEAEDLERFAKAAFWIGARGRGDLDPRVRVRGVPRTRRQRASRAVRAHPAASARRDAPGLGGGGLADAGRMAARGGARVLGPRLPRDRACGCGTGTRGHRRGARTGRSRPGSG